MTKVTAYGLVLVCIYLTLAEQVYQAHGCGLALPEMELLTAGIQVPDGRLVE